MAMRVWFGMRRAALWGALLLVAGVSPRTLALGTPHNPVDEDLQMWNQLVLWSPEYRRLFALAQVEPRLGENITRCRQLLLRGGVFYRVNSALSAGVTYDWRPDFYPTRRVTQTIAAQIDVRQRPVREIQIAHRFRYEHRFFKDAPHSMERLRLRHRLVRPLGKSPYYAVLMNELFINLNRVNRTPAGFDQNRAFIGMGRHLGPYAALEGGYQLTYTRRLGASADSLYHTVVFQATLNLRNVFAHPKTQAEAPPVEKSSGTSLYAPSVLAIARDDSPDRFGAGSLLEITTPSSATTIMPTGISGSSPEPAPDPVDSAGG